jgi:hypothetical protein
MERERNAQTAATHVKQFVAVRCRGITSNIDWNNRLGQKSIRFVYLVAFFVPFLRKRMNKFKT